MWLIAEIPQMYTMNTYILRVHYAGYAIHTELKGAKMYIPTALVLIKPRTHTVYTFNHKNTIAYISSKK